MEVVQYQGEERLEIDSLNAEKCQLLASLPQAASLKTLVIKDADQVDYTALFTALAQSEHVHLQALHIGKGGEELKRQHWNRNTLKALEHFALSQNAHDLESVKLPGKLAAHLAYLGEKTPSYLTALADINDTRADGYLNTNTRRKVYEERKQLLGQGTGANAACCI